MTTDTSHSDPGSGAPAGIWATFRDSSVAVKAILGGVVVNRVCGFLNIFLVLFLVADGYSSSQAAAALGVYGAGGVVGVLVGGTLAERLGARNATVLSMVSSAVLIAALPYLPTYSALLVAVAAVGIVGQIFRPASATLLSELTPDDRQVMIFAMYRFGLNVGTTAAPLIGFALYNLGGGSYLLLFWAEAAFALAYAVLAQFTLPARVAAAGTLAEGPGQPAGGYRAVLRDRRYSFYLVATFLNACIYMQYLSTLPLDVVASGVPIFWFTLAVALNGLVVILFELPLTKLSQKLPFKVPIVVSFVLVGVGYAFYGLPLGPAVIITGTLIWTAAEIIGAPTAFAYPAIAAQPQLKSHYIGSFQFMFGLGTAVGPVAGGVLYTYLGHGVWPLFAAVSMLAVGFGLIGVVSGKRPTGTAAEVAAVESPAAVDEPSGATP
jgi:predicted MFS family arabinose efflux permease